MPVLQENWVLCGSYQDRQTNIQCARARAVVDQDGYVFPCIFSLWLRIGNVRTERFASLMRSETTRRLREDLTAAFSGRGLSRCDPDDEDESETPARRPAIASRTARRRSDVFRRLDRPHVRRAGDSCSCTCCSTALFPSFYSDIGADFRA